MSKQNRNYPPQRPQQQQLQRPQQAPQQQRPAVKQFDGTTGTSSVSTPPQKNAGPAPVPVVTTSNPPGTVIPVDNTDRNPDGSLRETGKPPVPKTAQDIANVQPSNVAADIIEREDAELAESSPVVEDTAVAESIKLPVIQPKANERRRCENCFCWEPPASGFVPNSDIRTRGQCRANPPAYNPGAAATFPQASNDSWCLRFIDRDLIATEDDDVNLQHAMINCALDRAE